MPRFVALLLAALLAVTLTACAPTVPMQPAPSANSPACAEIMVRLPSELAGKARRSTDAQATAAWGDPTAALLSCGVDAPVASVLPCQTVDGVDWLVDSQDSPRLRLTVFGRTPSLQLFIDTSAGASIDSAAALSTLSEIIAAHSTQTAQCTPRPGNTG